MTPAYCRTTGPTCIMDLCPGGSLTQWLKPENRPSEERVRQVGVRIADALAAAHACGVLHRDVKPANILIDSHGNPRLADFGLAAVAGAVATAAESLPATPAYAPPEAFAMQPATEACRRLLPRRHVVCPVGRLPSSQCGRLPRHFRADGRGCRETNRPATRGQSALNGCVDDRPEQRPRGSTDRGQVSRTTREVPAPSISKRRLGGDASGTAALLPRAEWHGTALSAISTSPGVPTATAADSQRAPGRAAPHHTGEETRPYVAALAAIVITVMQPQPPGWSASPPRRVLRPRSRSVRCPRHRVPATHQARVQSE